VSFGNLLTYLFVGHFLWTGSFEPIHCWRTLEGNRVRFIITLLIIFAIVAAFESALLAVGAVILVEREAGHFPFRRS
jgi:hypothetical protein